MWRNFPTASGCSTVGTDPFVYPFIHQQIPGLLLPFGCCDQCAAVNKSIRTGMYTLLSLKWITNKDLTRTYQETLLSVMWQPGWQGSLGENEYMDMYGWVPLLSTWSHHNIVHQLYSKIKVQLFISCTPSIHVHSRLPNYPLLCRLLVRNPI